MPPIKIVFQNAHLVAIDKDSGMLSVPSRLGKEDSRPVAGILLQKQLGRQVYPVHRLDLEVSGLLLFALTQEAHKVLNKAFEDCKIFKTYEACTNKEASKIFSLNKTYEWTSKIVRGKKRSFEAPYGKDSLTLAAQTEPGLWRVSPKTGRPHQIRFEFYKNKIPILNDTLYGGSSIAELQGIALRAVEISFLDSPWRQSFDLPEKLFVGSSLSSLI
jgi:tRNA pseudouridine32 synthase/23S rRNA pseudouridine746 synthase